jgi:hypothetical protein
MRESRVSLSPATRELRLQKRELLTAKIIDALT